MRVGHAASQQHEDMWGRMVAFAADRRLRPAAQVCCRLGAAAIRVADVHPQHPEMSEAGCTVIGQRATPFRICPGTGLRLTRGAVRSLNLRRIGAASLCSSLQLTGSSAQAASDGKQR